MGGIAAPWGWKGGGAHSRRDGGHRSPAVRAAAGGEARLKCHCPRAGREQDLSRRGMQRALSPACPSGQFRLRGGEPRVGDFSGAGGVVSVWDHWESPAASPET